MCGLDNGQGLQEKNAAENVGPSGATATSCTSPAKFARKLQIFTRVESNLVRVQGPQIAEGLRTFSTLIRSIVVVDALVGRHQTLLLE